MEESSRDAVTPQQMIELNAVTTQQMNELRNAAENGSVDCLYSLISRDIDILDKIDKMPFVETPLHTAAVAGQIEFAMEILKLKRSFSKKLNKDGYTPMHLALEKNKTEMVHCLLDFDEELVRVHGKNGLTPLHHVARKGNLHLLVIFLQACPRSVQDVTNKKETVLHVALKSKKFEAFQLLLEWLRRTWFRQAYSWEKKLLNAKDKDGHTVSDIAVLSKKNSNYKDVEYNIGLDSAEAEKLHEEKEGIGDKQVQYFIEYFKSPVNLEDKIYIFFLRQTANISDSTRNALLVVAVLLLTINYQATVTPPGGVSQDNSHSKFQNRIRAGFNSGFFAPPSPYAVGTATMEENIFVLISVLNCVSFFVSIFSLILLLPTDFRSGMFGLPLYVLSLCFLAALFITAPIKVFPFHMPRNYYILFCVFSPLLFLALQGFVLYRQKKLVQAFIRQPKELDPSLHMSSTLF